jgi:hypothetical protein
MIMAGTPPIVIAVGLLRFVPVIVTIVPTGPADGVNEAMVGAIPKAFDILKLSNKKESIILFIRIF